MRSPKFRFGLRALFVAIAAFSVPLTVLAWLERDRATWHAYDRIHAMGFNSTVGYDEEDRFVAEFTCQRSRLSNTDAIHLAECLRIIASRHEIRSLDLRRTRLSEANYELLKDLLPGTEILPSVAAY